jgi:hypothetical protein
MSNISGANWRFCRSIGAGILISVLCMPLSTASQPPRNLAISLDGLLRFLEKYPGDDASAAMVIRLIRIHGVNFRPTAEDLAKLKQASASSELLEAIELARKPPEPVIKKGKLAVACQPVDCAVSLDDRPIGFTDGGILPPIAISAGPVMVSATRTSYAASSGIREVLIRENETTYIQFELEPSRSALVAAGSNRFQQMLDSVGQLSDLSSGGFRLAGTFYVHDRRGRSVPWSVVVSFLAQDQARFEISRAREKYQITRTKAGYVWKRPPKTEEAREMEAAIRLAMDGQLPNVIQRLKDPQLTMIAADLTAGARSVVLRAEGASGNYTITLDSANRPCEIELQSSGLNSGLRILYADYTQENGGFYPRTVQIILPDRAGGIEARFDRVEVGLAENKYAKVASR